MAKYDINADLPNDYGSLVKVYRALAKRADQRLVRLEAYQHEQNFKTATKWAYARAMRDIKTYSGEGATRFNTAPPESVVQLQEKIEDIKTFLMSPSSTKKGIIDIYKKKADTINARYGTNFKWDEIGKFFNSKLATDLDKKMASKTMLRVVGQMQKNKKNIIAAIKNANAVDLKVPDSMERKMIEKAIAENGEDILELFSK